MKADLLAEREALNAELAAEREKQATLKTRATDLLGKYKELREKHAQAETQWQHQKAALEGEIADLGQLLERTKAELHMINTAEQVLFAAIFDRCFFEVTDQGLIVVNAHLPL